MAAEFWFRESDDEFWIDVHVMRAPYAALGPFETPAERQRALDDLLAMTRSHGAQDLPRAMQ